MSSPDDIRIGARLKKARNALGLTLQDVANRIGFNNCYQILSNIEKGERPAKVSELTKLCSIYHKNASFFLSVEEPQNLAIKLAWRKKQVETDMREINSKIKEMIENYKLLEKLSDEESKTLSIAWHRDTQIKYFEDAEVLAEKTVEGLDLGYRPGVNLSEVMEDKLNVRVIYYDLQDYSSGLTAIDDDSVTVIVNRFDVPGRRNFSLAHELFHIYSSNIYPLSKLDDYNANPKGREEKLADNFAAALLLPKKSILGEFRKKVKNNRISYIDLISLALEFEVSKDTLMWRLKNLKLLDIDKLKIKEVLDSAEFKTLDNESRTGKRAPALKFSQRFVKLGLKALRDGKISKGKFCKIFEINRAEFSEFLDNRGFNEDFIYNSEFEINYS